jgi:Phage integrase family
VEADEDWVFPNPATGKPYWQEEIQKRHITAAAMAGGLIGIAWHTFRHTYRTLLDETGAPMKVQQELMRHASIQTTMNVYCQVLSDTKRQPKQQGCAIGAQAGSFGTCKRKRSRNCSSLIERFVCNGVFRGFAALLRFPVSS